MVRADDARLAAADPDHNLFSTKHPDVDATDVPANGEVLTYSAGKWSVSATGGVGSIDGVTPNVAGGT